MSTLRTARSSSHRGLRAGLLALVTFAFFADALVFCGMSPLCLQALAITGLLIAAVLLHVLWVDAYMSLPVVRWSVPALVVAAAAALFWARVARPYATASRPYRVLAVTR